MLTGLLHQVTHIHVEHSILEKSYDLHVEWQNRTGCLELCVDNFFEKNKRSGL